MKLKTYYVCLLLLSQLLMAWNKRAHYITVFIAYEHLSDQQKQNILGLLKHHPDFETWQIEFNTSEWLPEFDLYLLMRASTWADAAPVPRRSSA